MTECPTLRIHFNESINVTESLVMEQNCTNNFSTICIFNKEKKYQKSKSSIYYILISVIMTLFIVSLIGTVAIILTYGLYDKFRNEHFSFVILNSSIAMLLQIISFQYLFSLKLLPHIMQYNFYTQGCKLFIFLMRYSTLVILSLCLFNSHRLYHKFVLISSCHYIENLKLKVILIGWIMPLVVLLVTTYKHLSIDDSVCLRFIMPKGFFIPFSILFGLNLFFYIYLIISFYWNKYQRSKVIVKSGKSVTAWQEIKMFVLVCLLLNLPWIFFVVAQITSFGNVLRIILFFTNFMIQSSQGFVMFVLFICKPKHVRTFWRCIFLK